MDFSSCEWFPTSLLVLSDNVFSPLIYYSHITSFLIALLFGFFVFFKSKKNILGSIIFILFSLFSLWVFSDLILWATNKPSQTMFFWSLVNMIEPMIYCCAFYLSYVFFKGEHPQFKRTFLMFLPLLPTIILMPTFYAINGFNFSNCDREAVEGPLVYYGYFIEMVYAFCIIILSGKYIYRIKVPEIRKKNILYTIGISLFLFAFAFGNISGSLTVDWTVGQYGLIGMPLFIGFLSYLITKYKTFDIKVLSTQILVVSSWILVLSLLFVKKLESIRFIVIFTLFATGVIGYMVIRSVLREVQQRKHLEELSQKLAEANDHLQDLDKLKNEFLSLASHQLRSPLTAIRGYTSMLVEGSFGEIKPEQKEVIERVSDSSRHLAMVVEDLLNVSKIEQGGLKYEMSAFDISTTAESIAKDLKVTAEKKGLQLNYSNDGLPHIVFGDPEKLRQVVLNLVDNSVKYTPTGSVNVSVSNLERDGRVFVHITVKDTGIGIAPEAKAGLFEKFNRGDGAKVNVGGSGLGLYLAREIVKAHKGQVLVDSEGKDKGSTFTLELEQYQGDMNKTETLEHKKAS